MDLKYTITKFDTDQKVVVVTFEDGTWAELRLAVPLPKNKEELEGLIKQFAAPVEAIEAQISPDADLSYIEEMVGVENVCQRLRLIEAPESNTLDSEVENATIMWEQIQFQKKVGEALVALGVVESLPNEIPVTTL